MKPYLLATQSLDQALSTISTILVAKTMSREHFEKPAFNFRLYLEYLVYLAFRIIEELVCALPSDKHALAFGRFFGRVMFIMTSERRQVAIDNLTTCFGDTKDQKTIRNLARANFEHFGMLGVEFFRLRRWTEDDLAERLIISGKKNFDYAWSPGNAGVYYITGHFGSFEVLAAMSRFMGIRGKLLVTAVPNYFVNKRMIFERGGSKSGLEILPHRGSVHTIVDALNRGEMVVVLADQRGDDTRPTIVDFFGRKVFANGVFAKFAIEGKALVFPIRGKRLDDGCYECEFGDEIPIRLTGDHQTDLRIISQQFHDVFESWLRETPEQGFWMHRKFRRKSKKRSNITSKQEHDLSANNHINVSFNRGRHEGL